MWRRRDMLRRMEVKMTFWEEVELVFSEIGWVPAICLILGTILIIVEIFQPGFGFFGISGGILVVIGIIWRIYNSGGGNPVIQFFVLLALVLGTLAIATVIMMIALKKGWLARTGLVNKDTAVSTGQTKGTEDFGDIVGKTGVTLCALRPSGRVEIEGKVYDVVSNAVFIAKGCTVVVDSVEGGKITVKLVEETKQ